MYKIYKKNKYSRIIKKIPNLTSESDLLGQDKNGNLNDGSFLFCIMVKLCGRLLSNDPNETLSKRSVKFRKKYIHKLLIKICPLFLNGKKFHLVKTSPIPMDRPIIFAPNHGFTEDTASSILAAEEQAYIMFGSLPQFFNTFNGVGAYLNGSILVNRKEKSSRKASIEKAVQALNLGTNLILFPEGVFNKSPNELLLPFWSGIYRIAERTNALIVPIVHLRVGNNIYSSRLEPFDISKYVSEYSSSEEACSKALDDLRDLMASELFEMIEKYSVSNRSAILSDSTSMHEASERIVAEQVREAGKYYDYDIETKAHYKKYVPISEVWDNIANLNITENQETLSATSMEKEFFRFESRAHAKVYVKEDYQRRF